MPIAVRVFDKIFSFLKIVSLMFIVAAGLIPAGMMREATTLEAAPMFFLGLAVGCLFGGPVLVASVVGKRLIAKRYPAPSQGIVV